MRYVGNNYSEIFGIGISNKSRKEIFSDKAIYGR